MQKVKFKIKSLSSKSEAAAVEEKLKAAKGVIMPKVNYASGKAVIVYDENKIEEKDLEKIINNEGGFRVSRPDEGGLAPEIKKVNDTNSQSEPVAAPGSPVNNPLIVGVITGIGIMSIIINLILWQLLA